MNRFKKQFFLLSLAILAVIFLCGNGYSADVGNNRKKSSGSLPVDVEFQPELGTYHYDVYWRKMLVGKASITIEREGELYKVVVAGKTNKKVSLLYKAKYRGEVQMESYPLTPIKAEIREQTRKKTKTVNIDFPETDRVKAVEVKTEKGKEPSITEREFTSETFVLDPFSTVFLVRQLDWEVGMAEVFDLFTGKKEYELQLLCDSVTTLTVGKHQREVWVIIPQTKSLEKDGEVKKSDFKVYLSKDAKREVLKIEGAPQVGRVIARIRKFEPLPDRK